MEVELLAANLLTTKRDFGGHMAARSLHMLTLTIGHHNREPLAKVLTRLQDASNRLVSGRMGAGWRELGLELVCRSLEITYGKNGWHPHLHLIVAHTPLPLGSSFTPEAQACDLFASMNKAWLRLTKTADGVGFRADPIQGRTVGEIAGYVAGVRQAARGAALEGVRHDLKRGRHENASIFEVPALLAASMQGEAVKLAGTSWNTDKLVRLWNEWEVAMRGIHQVAIGRGLADLRPTKEEIVERLRDLATPPTEEQTTWETVAELTLDDLRLLRRYGTAPILKAAALHGKQGVESALDTYRQRWKRSLRATIFRKRSDGRDFVGSQK